MELPQPTNVVIALNPNSRFEELQQISLALKKETDRGKACVADAVIDALLEELFSKGLLPLNGKSNSRLNHAARLSLAKRLGWIGEKTYQACKDVNDIRNKMAHRINPDSFDHGDVASLVDGLPLSKPLDKFARNRGDRFTYCFLFILSNLWMALERCSNPKPGFDTDLFAMGVPASIEPGK